MEILPLKFRIPVISKRDLIKGSHNQEAIDFLFHRFNDYADNIVLISGPGKVGKSFITKVFLQEINGKEINFNDIDTLDKIEALARSKDIYLLEDIHNLSLQQEMNLFNFYNLLPHSDTKLILTSKLPIRDIKFQLPDLYSRLLNTATIYIREPDDNDIIVMAFKMFQDKQLKPKLHLIKYIVTRIERKGQVLYELIEAIEREMFTNKQNLSMTLIKNVLQKINNRV